MFFLFTTTTVNFIIVRRGVIDSSRTAVTAVKTCVIVVVISGVIAPTAVSISEAA